MRDGDARAHRRRTGQRGYTPSKYIETSNTQTLVNPFTERSEAVGGLTAMCLRFLIFFKLSYPPNENHSGLPSGERSSLVRLVFQRSEALAGIYTLELM